MAARRAAPDDERSLELIGLDRRPSADHGEQILLHTNDGTIDCRLHETVPNAPAILWVFGAGGGLGGPAGGVYVRLAEQFVSEGIASLRLDYRHPGDLINCVLDALMGIEFLSQSQHPEVILVGHSFGGAVVISAGALSDRVIGVAALSSQNQGTDLADRLAPKPLLVAHGLEDEVLPASCSRSIYARAGAPKELILYPNCRHGLDECREELDRDLTRWIREIRESLLSVKSAN